MVKISRGPSGPWHGVSETGLHLGQGQSTTKNYGGKFMSQYEREDMDVIGMVQENRRRQNITRQVGYIVTREEAQELAVRRAREENTGDGLGGVILFTVAMVMILVTAVSILG